MAVLEASGTWTALQDVVVQAHPQDGLTRSQYVATHRAVKALERRGLVDIRGVEQMSWGSGHGGERRGAEIRQILEFNA